MTHTLFICEDAMFQQWHQPCMPEDEGTNEIWADLHCDIMAEMGVGRPGVETYDDALGVLTAGGWCSDYYFTRKYAGWPSHWDGCVYTMGRVA